MILRKISHKLLTIIFFIVLFLSECSLYFLNKDQFNNMKSSSSNQSTVYKYFLYFGNNLNGMVYYYKFDIDMATGYLSNMNSFLPHEASYIVYDAFNKYLYSASPSANGIYKIQINIPDGALINQVYQGMSNPANKMKIHPNGNFMFGLMTNDIIFSSSINPADGSLEQPPINEYNNATGAIISGVFDLGIKPTGDYLYVVNNNSPYNINCYAINPVTGTISLSPVQQITSPGATNPEAIVIHSSLNYLYVAYAGSNNIQVFTINPLNGNLALNSTLVPANGTNPDCMIIDQTGNYLYCANFNSIAGYSINQANGTLTSLPGSPYVPFGGHTNINYITIDPTGNYLYAPMNGSSFVDGFTINKTNGALTPFPVTFSYSPDSNASNPVVIGIPQ